MAELQSRVMLSAWLVRLELARDDDDSLSDEGIEALTQSLTERHVNPVLARGDSGTVLVEMTLEARDDMAARTMAEHTLREGANTAQMKSLVSHVAQKLSPLRRKHVVCAAQMPSENRWLALRATWRLAGTGGNREKCPDM